MRISTIVLTSSVVLPIIHAAGIDPLWFGIFLVITVETAQITPPVGFNLFVLQGMTGKQITYLARVCALTSDGVYFGHFVVLPANCDSFAEQYVRQTSSKNAPFLGRFFWLYSNYVLLVELLDPLLKRGVTSPLSKRR